MIDPIEKALYEVLGIMEMFKSSHLSYGELFDKLQEVVNNGVVEQKINNCVLLLKNLLTMLPEKLILENGYDVKRGISLIIDKLKENYL